MYYVYIIYLLFLTKSEYSKSFNLTSNIKRIWLPNVNGTTASIILVAENGNCNQWSIVRGMDITSLKLDDINYDFNCSVKVTVSTLPKSNRRTTAVISGRHTDTGKVVYYDIIVSAIASLGIITKTKELIVGDAPELYEFSAYDEQGNIFSTLDGVEYEWSVNDDSIPGVLKLMILDNSHTQILPPEFSESFSNNRRRHVVPVQGIQIGSSKLSVSLKSSNIKTHVQLHVIDDLVLEPERVTILLGDRIQINIFKFEDRRKKKWKVNDEKYSLEMISSKTERIIRYLNKTNEFYGVTEGQDEIKLKDVIENKIYGMVSSIIYVKKANRLSIVFQPVNSRNLAIGNIYLVEVHLYSSDDQRITIGPNVKVNIKLCQKYFEKLYETLNGTYILVRTLKTGITTIKALLKQPYQDEKLNVNIKTAIHPKIKITPHYVIFPSPHTYENNSSMVQLKVFNENSNYEWIISNRNVCFVSSLGYLTPLNFGKAIVKAAMTLDPTNYDESIVHVIIPDELQAVVQPAEQEIGRPIILYLQLFIHNEDGRKNVTVCNLNHFYIDVCDEVDCKPFKGEFDIKESCAAISMTINAVSMFKITINYKTYNMVLTAKSIVKIFPKLVPLYPQSGHLILAQSSEATLLFYGGPRNIANNYNIQFVTNNTLIKSLEIPITKEIYDYDTYGYRVKCTNKLGKAKATLIIERNFLTSKIDTEIIALSSVEIICALPKNLRFLSINDSEQCILKRTNEVFVNCKEDIYVRIDIMDENENIFYNATGINGTWIVKNPSVLKNTVRFATNEIEKKGFKFVNYHYAVFESAKVACRTDATFTIENEGTSCVESTIFGFSSKKKLVKLSSNVISETLTLSLINPVMFTFTNLTSTFQPMLKCIFYLENGSGCFDIETVPYNSAVIVERQRTIEVMPKSIGHINIIVRDLCSPSKEAEALLVVKNVHRIEVIVDEFLEINSEAQIFLNMYDSDDNLLSFEFDDSIYVRPIYKSGIISVKKKKSTIFIIKGVKIGDTKIYFAMDSFNSKEIRSPQITVRVYFPLKLSPSTLTLTVGAHYWLTISGGPQVGSVFEYSTNTERIVEMSIEGVVKAIALGTAKITCKAINVDKPPSNFNHRRIITSDEITVKVIQMTNAKIEVPVLKMQVGQIIPAWVRGIPVTLDPMIIGTIDPPLTFHWSTSTTGVVKIFDVMEESGILVRAEDRISVRIQAIKKGSTLINVSIYNSLSGTYYKSSIGLTIYEELYLSTSGLTYNSLLLAPETDFTLNTNNNNKLVKNSYKIMGSNIEDSENDLNYLPSNYPIISIDENSGILRTSNISGNAYVMVISTDNYNTKQTLTIAVEVKKVEYIMIFVKEPCNPIHKFLKLQITYHDSKGNQFKAVNSDLMYTKNYNSQVQITRDEQKNTFLVSLLKSGHIMLKIWYRYGDNDFNEDYVKFSIKHLIYPNQVFASVGDVICFFMPIKFEDGSREWNVDNMNSLMINKSSGFAVATAPSESVSVYYSSSSLQTSTWIRILPIKNILILNTEKITLYNSAETFDVQLILLNEQESTHMLKNKKGNMWEHCDDNCFARNVTIKDFPYKCYASFKPFSSNEINLPSIKRVFDVTPYFNIKTGFYSCRLTPLLSNDLEVCTIKANIIVQVMSDSTYAESKEIPFLPNVCVNTYELYFGQFSGCDMLTVTGLPNILFAVQVSSSNNSLVMPMIHSQSENSRVYSFNVNPLFWELGKMDIYILVTSEIIPQTINISIRTPFSKVVHDISKIISRNTSSHGSYFDSVFLSKFYISFSIIFLTIFYVCFYGLPVCLSFNTSVNDRYHRNGQDETGSNNHFVGFYNRSSSSCKDFQRRTKRYYF